MNAGWTQGLGKVKGITLEIRLQKTGLCFAGILSPWSSLSTAVLKQAALMEGVMWQGTRRHPDNSRKGNEILGPAAHKELNPALKLRVDLEVAPPPIEPGEEVTLATSWVQPCEKPLSRGTWVSLARIPDPQKLGGHQCVLF